MMKRTGLLLLLLVFIGCSQPKIPRVPDWAYDAVWYQIFPERFNNGDPANDPTVETLDNTWPYMRPEGWQIAPWTSDWYKRQPWEVKTGEKFNYISQLRRYGGDLQGVIDKLDYIKELGVNAIYLNPIFESPSLHKYGCSMYRHIDNNFGPDPAGDVVIWNKENPIDPSTWQWTEADKLFLKLLDEAHKRNIKVIIDGVFNHVGIPFWAFQDVWKNGKNSPYSEWFVVKRFDDPTTPEDEFEYDGWYGVKDLPEVWEDENGPCAEFSNHINNIVKRWGDPNGDGDPRDGIDGWRLDVAEKVSIEFWKDFRVMVKNVNPNAYITGEIWWEDFSNNKIFDASPWLQGDVFDAVMNYRFGDAMLKAFVDQKMHIKPSDLDCLLGFMRDNYALENQHVLQNLMASHDTERFSSMIMNPDRMIDHGGNLQNGDRFDTRKPSADDKAIQKTILTFQFTYLGTPFIYYGDEVGMWGADDPDCRKPMVWSGFNYEPEVTSYSGKKQPADQVDIDYDLLTYYQSLINLRNTYKSLSRGTYQTVLCDDKTGLYAFERSYKKEKIRAVFNLSDEQQIIPKELLFPNGTSWKIIWGNGNGLESIGSRSGIVFIESK